MKPTLLAAFLAAMLTFIVTPQLASAQPQLPCTAGSLPSNDPEYPNNQLILVCVPPSWNGDLVVYAHGYVPPQLPPTLPLQELTLSDGTFVPAPLLAQGIAFVTSSYHKTGAATEQAIQDLLALIHYFESSVAPGSVKRVFIAGGSEGGLIALQLLEQHPNQFSAGLALCSPTGGAPKQIKYFEDFRVVFDYFFPDVFPFGVFGAPPITIDEWQTVYIPRIIDAMQTNLAATAQLFSVTRAAFDPADLQTFAETAIGLLSLSVLGNRDLVATADGIPYDNRFTLYLGLTNNLALNRSIERIKGDREAEDYARSFYQTTGNLQRPLVALHTTLDPLVPFDHELIYSGLVALQRKSRFLTVLPINRYGHCEFTTSEILNAFALMLQKASPQP